MATLTSRKVGSSRDRVDFEAAALVYASMVKRYGVSGSVTVRAEFTDGERRYFLDMTEIDARNFLRDALGIDVDLFVALARKVSP